MTIHSVMKTTIPPISILKAFYWFGSFTLLLYLATRHVMPLLLQMKIHPALSWFLASGFLVFIPLFVMTIRVTRREIKSRGRTEIMNRLWLKKLSRSDWAWTFTGVIIIIFTTGIIIYIVNKLFLFLGLGPLQTSPSFMHFDPLQPNEYWILGIWVLFFFFNIVGEEVMWRGYLLPGLLIKYENKAWIINAVLWIFFHIPFGMHLIILVLPTFFLIPYIVQKRKNTWIGIIIHGAINAPGFILVSFGIV